jgi:hypothetical protein
MSYPGLQDLYLKINDSKRPIGENIIKAEVILSAWLSYCRESRIYRILEFFGLR